MASVGLDRITKRYGSTAAVESLSLAVNDGEFVCLLGPSGCGKTTLLRIIAGLISPDSGRVFIGGRDATRVPPGKRNSGMVYQNYALFPHMTVAQNVEFGLRVRRISEVDRRSRVAEAIDRVKLTGFEQRYPRQLSGGQQQRTAVARAIVVRPDILLLDEPLGALDRKLRVEMQVELRLLQKALRVTTVFVTHDQEEALTMSDRVAVMREGRIEQIGPVREIYEQPATEFVATFIGTANVFSATVTSVHDGVALVRTGAGTELTVSASTVGLGASAFFAIRPEKLFLSSRSPTNQENVLLGKITNVVYLGSMTRYDLEAAGLRLEALTQNSSARGDTFEVGSSVFVHIGRDAVLTLDGPDGGRGQDAKIPRG